MGKMNGFTDEQILEIRTGQVAFDVKLDALAKYVKNVTVNRSKPDAEVVDNLLNAGYDKASIVDIIIVIGDKMISNFLYGTTKIPIDFPLAPALSEQYA